MQLVYDAGQHRYELDVQINTPSATVGDLAAALVPGGSTGDLLIGAYRPDPELELREAGLHEGAVLRFSPSRRATSGFGGFDRGSAGGFGSGGSGTDGFTHSWSGLPAAGTQLRELVVANGLDAGRRFPLHPGTFVLGRSERADVTLRQGTVSKRHASVTVAEDGSVTVADLGSHNGTLIDGKAVTAPTPLSPDAVLQVGSLELEVRGVEDRDRPVAVDPLRYAGPAGTIPFNRPPRPAPPPEHEQVEVPDPPRKNRARRSLSILAMVGPLIFAGGMYLVRGSTMFLMFAALSPIMALFNWLGSRRQGKKQARNDRIRYRRELAEFLVQLDAVAVEERRRRLDECPDPVELIRRSTLPSTMLWERRPEHDDFLHLRAGIGDVPWDPPVRDRGGRNEAQDELTEAIDRASVISSAPVLIDLSEGGVVGIVGDRAAATCLARSLVCQAAALHGPADLPMMVLASQEAAPAWDWAKWLPHTRDATGQSRHLSGHPDVSAQMAEARLHAFKAEGGDRRRPSPREKTTGPTLLAVVDDQTLTEGRRAPTRNLLRGEAGPVAGIVLADTVDRLPAMCTAFIDLSDEDGTATLVRPQERERIDGFLACGVSDDVARDLTRELARFEDPELQIAGAGLPSAVRLLPLLEMDDFSVQEILARWKSGGLDPAPAGPIGMSEDGVFSVNFVEDGPHGLVGGTTGAGKSELLRTLVAGLAASVDPDHLTFVLIDFKGGSAFDVCAKLPHTVGMVTDLDEHLAERALRCLEAELKHRERVLRAAGASDLPDYLRNAKGDELMPRLVVIIDEFATVKAELPAFIDALVGVAQRGRSLGVHMLLATQRPQGAINENIKANTNLRIALRTQDRSDSNDILGVPDAADIARKAAGRAYVRLGPSEVVAIQSGWSTGPYGDESQAAVDLAPFVYGPSSRPPAPPGPPSGALAATADGAAIPGASAEAAPEVTDLEMLVETINQAFTRTGSPVPRRPWPEPLPAEVDLDDLLARAYRQNGDTWPAFVPVALADDPDAQTQYPVGWRPQDGNLLLYGLVGAGTTTALHSLALAMARLYPPADLHLYAIDLGGGELAALTGLPHCGGVALAHERERQQRIVRMLREELDRRRQMTAAERAQLPRIVAMLDGWPAFMEEFKDLASQGVVETVTRVFADGPEVGVNLMLTADRGMAIGQKIAATVRQKWAFRLADKGDYGVVDVRGRAVPQMIPGHALVSESRQLVHIARPAEGPAAAVDRIREQVPAPPAERAPVSVRSLPSEVSWADLGALGARAHLGERPWRVPVALAEADLQPASVEVYEGEHLFVAGPARSGKSSTLLMIADAVRAAEPEAYVVGIATRRSPLSTDRRIDQLIDPSDVEPLREAIGTEAPVTLVLIDDGQAIDDKKLQPLGASTRPNLLVAAAARSDAMRGGSSHWTGTVRQSKTGILLMSAGGDLLGAKLPRRSPVEMVPGRGYVVNNSDATLAQIAQPGDLGETPD